MTKAVKHARLNPLPHGSVGVGSSIRYYKLRIMLTADMVDGAGWVPGANIANRIIIVVVIRIDGAGNHYLVKVVLALGQSRLALGRRQRRQQQRRQNGDDGYHHQKFNERESPRGTAPGPAASAISHEFKTSQNLQLSSKLLIAIFEPVENLRILLSRSSALGGNEAICGCLGYIVKRRDALDKLHRSVREEHVIPLAGIVGIIVRTKSC